MRKMMSQELQQEGYESFAKLILNEVPSVQIAAACFIQN
jgi:hypothetical protein